eukprot:NODE_370_length_2348_cov_67.060896_g345_i0.p1 GENE.NODE_370_length_2348_cov_67.060896_g345_i0~~NODE_370_length_2348_cov_67.060896_g345_i0.p1  ORF type:complete len:345 (-),score=45.38 NODE_370_length_2348_cov_67.060896_g345_i0:81-1115(-)
MISFPVDKVLCLNFNQDCSCLAVGTEDGFKIFSCDPYRKCYQKKDGGMGLVSMLYCTSLLAIVGAGQQASLSPRRLQLFNSSEQKSICELNFMDSILNVKLNKKRLVVVLEFKLHIFDISTMKLLQSANTNANPKGLVGLSMGEDISYVAYPWSSESGTGDVIVMDAVNLHKVSVIKAHKTVLSSLAFSNDGNRLATSSSKGTVIRVFDIPESRLVYTLRRGSVPAQIYSLSFNASATLLCVSSDTGTIHIFKLSEAKKNFKEGMSVGSIQDTLNNMLVSVRDFAHLKVRSEGSARNICVIPEGDTRVFVATYDGFLYQFGLDAVNGGSCRLEKEYRLLDAAAV